MPLAEGVRHVVCVIRHPVFLGLPVCDATILTITLVNQNWVVICVTLLASRILSARLASRCSSRRILTVRVFLLRCLENLCCAIQSSNFAARVFYKVSELPKLLRLS